MMLHAVAASPAAPNVSATSVGMVLLRCVNAPPTAEEAP